VALPPAPDACQLHTTGTGLKVPVVGDELKVIVPMGGVEPVGSVRVAVHAVDALTDTRTVSQLNVVDVGSTDVTVAAPLLAECALSPE
jgi:hypothetical protein